MSVLEESLTLDAFLMEVKNYNSPWLPSRDGAVDVDALRLPFGAYHDAMNAEMGGEVFSAVVVDAAVQNLKAAEPFGFAMLGTAKSEDPPDAAGDADSAVTTFRFEGLAYHGVEHLLRAAKGEVNDEAISPLLKTWRERNENGVLIFAPYVISRDIKIAPLKNDMRAARSFFLHKRDIDDFMYIAPEVVSAQTKSHVCDRTYFAAGWLLGLPPTTDALDDILRYVRLIAIQYQMSWGYPAMVDFAAKEHEAAEFSAKAASVSEDDAKTLRRAAGRITRGVGYLRELLDAADQLVKIVDPISPSTLALRRAADLMNEFFPAGSPDHLLATHLKKPVADKKRMVEAIQGFLMKIERQSERQKKDDESLRLVADIRRSLNELRNMPAPDYDKALAHAFALARGTLLVQDDGEPAQWCALTPIESNPIDPPPFFYEGIVRLHELRTRRLPAIEAVIYKHRQLIFTVGGARDVVMSNLRDAMYRHWALLKTQDDGDWSKMFACLLRGMLNTDKLESLVKYANDKFIWREQERTLALSVDVREVAR